MSACQRCRALATRNGAARGSCHTPSTHKASRQPNFTLANEKTNSSSRRASNRPPTLDETQANNHEGRHRRPRPLVGRRLPGHRARDARIDAAPGLRASGMSPEEWEKIKAKEKKAKTNLGAGGARGFKSRSFDSFVAALEKGEADHLYAVNPEDVRKGKIALKDVPYMQRGGAWDNSDLKGKKGWMKTGFGMTAFNDGKADIKKMTDKDKAYLNAKPDIGIFGQALNWGGGAKGGDDLSARAKKNGLTNDQQMWRDSGALSAAEIARMNRSRGGGAPKIGVNNEQKEKKFFGLF